jgi:large subunit ribosomal protein L21
MFAIIESGGKQYKVCAGEVITTEIIPSKKEGDSILFDKVLFLSDEKEVKIGQPYLQNIVVQGKIQKEFKGEKLIAFKYRPKERYRRKVGHRQRYFNILIEQIKPLDEKSETKLTKKKVKKATS